MSEAHGPGEVDEREPPRGGVTIRVPTSLLTGIRVLTVIVVLGPIAAVLALFVILLVVSNMHIGLP